MVALKIYHKHRKLFFSVCFRFLNFSSIFPGGQLTPFAPMCGRPWWAVQRSMGKHSRGRCRHGRSCYVVGERHVSRGHINVSEAF